MEVVRACSSSRIMSSSYSAPQLIKKHPRPAAYVYCGPGAGLRSALSAMQSLRLALNEHVRVDRLTPEKLLASGWQEGCLLLVMPGGADLPYCKLLNGAGNQLIREYVEGGGSYLGLCAGAYYGCAQVEFEPGTNLEVVGERELSFFPGVARGSIYGGFDYESENEAAAARLRYLDLSESDSQNLASASSTLEAGQPTSQLPSPATSPTSPTANSSPQRAAQQGATWRECHDYINGGPGFFPFSVEDSPPSLPHPPPGSVTVLATYPERGDAAAALLCAVGAGRAVLCGTHPELAPTWLEPCLEGGAGEGAGEAAAAACSDSTRGWQHQEGELFGGKREAAAGGVLLGGSGDTCGDQGGAGSATALAMAGAGVAAAARESTVDGCSLEGQGTRKRESPPSHTIPHNGAASGAADAAGSCTDAIRRPPPGAPMPRIQRESAGVSEDSLHAAVPPALRHVRGVHAQLVDSQGERWRFWRGLLAAAGLRGWLRQQG